MVKSQVPPSTVKKKNVVVKKGVKGRGRKREKREVGTEKTGRKGRREGAREGREKIIN